MSLADDLSRFLTSGRHGAGAVGRGEALEEIKRNAGSGRKAAKALGIGETTWRRWYSGGKMPAARMPLVTSTVRGMWLDRAQAERLRAKDITITTTGQRAWANRKLKDRNLRFTPGMGDAVITRWLAGDDNGAARAFVAHIGDEWYRKTFFGEWLSDPAKGKGGKTTGSRSGSDDDDTDDDLDDSWEEETDDDLRGEEYDGGDEGDDGYVIGTAGIS